MTIASLGLAGSVFAAIAIAGIVLTVKAVRHHWPRVTYR
jgi:hypothetical protein